MSDLYLIQFILGVLVTIAITMVFMDRKERQKIARDLQHEIDILREALKQVSETHNNLTTVQKNQAMDLSDLTVKLEILMQGIPSPAKNPYGAR